MKALFSAMWKAVFLFGANLHWIVLALVASAFLGRGLLT